MNEKRLQSRSVRERVERLQAAFKPFLSAEGSVVDELIAERRGEAHEENREGLQAPSSGKRRDEPASRG